MEVIGFPVPAGDRMLCEGEQALEGAVGLVIEPVPV